MTPEESRRLKLPTQPPSESQRPAEESIARGAAYAFAVQVTTAFFTAVLTLYLVRALGPEAYGLFALALATSGLVAVPADFGMSQSTARFVAERRGDRSAMAEAVAAGFKPKLVSSALIAAGLFAASGWIASAYDNQSLTWPLRAAALVFFGQTLFLFFQRIFVAQGRIAPNLRMQIVESAVETGACVALVALGTGATGAMFGRAAGYVVGGAFALFTTVRFLGRASVALSGGLSSLSRRIIRYAGPLTIVDGAYTLFSQIDVVLIGLILNTVAVAEFQAPNRLIAFLAFPGAAVTSAVAPRFARRGATAAGLRPLESAIRYLVIVQGALVAPVLIWAGPIVEILFGSDYSKSADVLRALTPYVFLSGIAPLVSVTPNYAGAAMRRVPIVLVTVGTNAVIDILLIPRIGIVGGAIGTDVAYTFYVLAHLWICKRTLELSLRPLARVLLRTMMAAGAMAAVLLAVGTTALQSADWAVGVVGGSLAFAAVLVVTGEVSEDELVSAKAFATRRLRRV